MKWLISELRASILEQSFHPLPPLAPQVSATPALMTKPPDTENAVLKQQLAQLQADFKYNLKVACGFQHVLAR